MTEQEAGGRGVIKCHCCQRPVSFDTGSPSHLDGSPLCSQGRALSDGLRGMSMAEHLPECPVEKMLRSGRTVGSQSCICEELRACEQRVAEETEAAMIESFYWKPSPPHDRHYFADNICAYCVGYREAFTAARKAVAGLPEYAMRDTCVSAIDELREEKK